jgi:hypothetical protein
MAMFTRIALVLALIGTSVTASAAADRKVVPAWNSTTAYAQVQTHPNARSAQRSYNIAPSSLQSLYELSARIHRDTFTHD